MAAPERFAKKVRFALATQQSWGDQRSLISAFYFPLRFYRMRECDQPVLKHANDAPTRPINIGDEQVETTVSRTSSRKRAFSTFAVAEQQIAREAISPIQVAIGSYLQIQSQAPVRRTSDRGSLISDVETTAAVPRASRNDRCAALYVSRDARCAARDGAPFQPSVPQHLRLTPELPRD